MVSKSKVSDTVDRLARLGSLTEQDVEKIEWAVVLHRGMRAPVIVNVEPAADVKSGQSAGKCRTAPPAFNPSAI